MGHEEEMVINLAKKLASLDFPDSHWSYLDLNDKQELLNEAQEFLDGCRRGLQARREGKVRPWNEVKKELGIRVSFWRRYRLLHFLEIAADLLWKSFRKGGTLTGDFHLISIAWQLTKK